MATERDDRTPAETAEQALLDLGFDPAALRQRYREERDKRLREDGNEQYVEVKGEFAHFLDDPYALPGFTREPLFDSVEVLIVGGGFGGLLAGARLRQAGVEDIRPESIHVRHPGRLLRSALRFHSSLGRDCISQQGG